MPRLIRGRPPLALLLLLALLVVCPRVQAASVEVVVEGVEDAALENVRAMLSIVGEAEAEEADLEPARIRQLHRRAPDEIRRALEPYGYYAPSVEAELDRDDDEDWRATYRIDPGQRVRMTEVDIRIRGAAADDRAFTELQEGLALRAGEPLLHPAYAEAKQRLMELAAARGYFDATWVESTLRINPASREARARLVLDSGPRYRFGKVTFEQDFLDERLLRRFVPFRPGDPWLNRQLLDLQYGLDDSDYFRSVNVQPQRDRAQGRRVPVRVRLERRPQNRYTFGVGYGTDTGARISAGWENRWFNREGHSFDTLVELAEISTRVSARYRIPLADPARERLVLESSLSTEEIGDGETRQFAIGARRVEQSGRYQLTVSLDYERNRDTISGETITRDLVMPGAGLVYSRFNDPVYATRGYRLGGFLNGGTETFGSDVSFLRGRLSGHGVLGLWDGGRVLVRGQIGTTDVDDVDDLPLSQRFFAGGDDSVRGFAYESLGPQDEDGDVIGGQHLAVASVELEQLIVGNWGAAVFVDSGNAMDTWDVSLRTAAGLGLRYRSPVGVFRFDVAKAVDGDESARFHLSLGIDL